MARESTNRAAVCVLQTPALVAYLAEMCAAASAHGTNVAVLMLRLRQVDRIGVLTQQSDAQRVFHHVIEQIGRLLRPIDRFAVATYDEIWIVLPELAHQELATLAAHRILRELDAALGSSVRRAPIHPCIGIASFPEHATDVTRLVEAADAARRVAALNEDGFAMYALPELGALPDPALEDELRDAVRSNAIEVHYQPQIDLRTDRCRSAEVLLRWMRANGEQVSPTLVAEIAERTDILHPLTLLVLNMALRHAAAFRRSGPDVRLSVNLSAKLASDEELPELVSQLLETWNIPAARLTLEVTESAVLANTKRAADMLDRLKALGIRLAMDDFGTGYSSLAHLRRFPFDEVKIDKVFVANMLGRRGDLKLVAAMVDLAHNFGMEVVAEGVEDNATLAVLRELGCDLAQGYLIGKAMPEPKFRTWWADYEMQQRTAFVSPERK